MPNLKKVARSWAMRREYAQKWTDYSDIFNDQLYTFFSDFNRSRLKSIKMRNMRFPQFEGLQGLVRDRKLAFRHVACSEPFVSV